MKKATLLALACAFSMSFAAQAQQTQEVQYVEDPSQGYLFNKFSDNWFITGEAGANIYFSHGDSERHLGNRFAPAAGLYVGKWFSPIIGLRLGGSWLQLKGISTTPVKNGRPYKDVWKQKFNEFGPMADVLINVTNWWCGYHPGRKYNFIAYAGAGGYWTMEHRIDANGKYDGWHNDQDRILAVRVGIQNNFQVSKHFQLGLDVRYTVLDNHKDEAGDGWNRTSHDLAAFLTCSYMFNKTEWSAPVVPVCPEPENCDALRARLSAAEGRIADLENQLKDALNRPQPKAKKAPLATIYYPINVYRLTRTDVNILGAVSDVMKSNPSKHYTLTGWADNYTGTDEINVRLRHNRVNGVEKQLLKNGVPQSQITATINNGNLCDLGEKYVALDRAVTIDED